jgi:UDPglucose 6-dehydrogenase
VDIAVIGAGYVGLIQAAGLAHLGYRVRIGESNGDRVSSLGEGRLPIYEPGLGDLFERALYQGLISFHHDNLEAVDGAQVVFLTLPTPPNGSGAADLSIIEKVVDQIGPHLGPDVTLVTKSTVPVGTAARLQSRLRELGSEAGVVANPEFIAEGHAVDDFLKAERVVIGAFDHSHGRRVAELYRGLEAEVVLTDPATAELVKYAANAYLATRLTYANSIANIAEAVGADALTVLHAMGMDRRIGSAFLRPGPGYGGSCFPKDTRAFLAIAENSGYDFSLLRAVVETDERQRTRIVDRCVALLDGSLEGKRIGIWGIAFKAGTDDIRESPALRLAAALSLLGADVVMTDPEADTEDFTTEPNPVAAAEGADLLLVATEWPEFIRVPFDEVAKAMTGDIVYDVRNLLDPEAVRQAGLRYVGLGRPAV